MNSFKLNEISEKFNFNLDDVLKDNRDYIYYLDNRGLKYFIRNLFQDIASIDLNSMKVQKLKNPIITKETLDEYLLEVVNYLDLYQTKLRNTGYIPNTANVSNAVNKVFKLEYDNANVVKTLIDKIKELDSLMSRYKNEEISMSSEVESEIVNNRVSDLENTLDDKLKEKETKDKLDNKKDNKEDIALGEVTLGRIGEDTEGDKP